MRVRIMSMMVAVFAVAGRDCFCRQQSSLGPVVDGVRALGPVSPWGVSQYWDDDR